MAGRVLRSSNGRFNGSTKGFRKGKKPVDRRNLAKNNDIYIKKINANQFAVIRRPVTNKEFVFTSALIGGGGVYGGAAGAVGARVYQRKKAVGAETVSTHKNVYEARVAVQRRQAALQHRGKAVLAGAAIAVGSGVAVSLTRSAMHPASRAAMGRAFAKSTTAYRRQRAFKLAGVAEKAAKTRLMADVRGLGYMKQARKSIITNSFKITTLR